MATQPQPQPMSEEALAALITSTAKEAVGPAIKEALEPLTKAQTAHGELLAKLGKPEEDAPAFDEKVLGKYPYGRKAMAVALAALEGVPKEDWDGIAKVCKKHWKLNGSASIEKWSAYQKGLTVGTAATAGDMVFPQQDPEWIELLRNKAVVRGFARTLPMPRGSSSRRKQTGAATASYQGELGPISPSSQTVARANLSYKKLTAATVVSNDLIRFAGGEAERFVQEDLLRVTALREDRAFLVGNPPTDAGSPQGIRFQTAAANVAASAGATLANFQADLTDSIADVEDSNVDVSPENSFFVLSPRTFWTMYALATTTGDMIFAAMLSGAQPRIFGYPVLKTTQLSVANSWIGANGGLVMFVHGPSMEIHDSMARTVEAFRGGAYHDGSTIQSGISNDETVITCIAEHDFLQVYDVAAAIKTGYAT